MGITKKTAAGLTTTLCAGRRTGKDDIRIETCGCLDELCCFLGLAKSMVRTRAVKATLEKVQRDLFIIGSEVAASGRGAARLRRRIGPADVRRLEDEMTLLNRRRKFRPAGFYLPGGSPAAAALDIARAFARRLERRAVTLSRRRLMSNPDILAYLNMLSELLFALARRLETKPEKLIPD
jgi:cob(I)alamin adenosyltransferase